MKSIALALLLACATSGLAQIKFISHGLKDYHKPDTREKYYLSPPNVSFVIPLTNDLRNHWITSIAPTIVGWRGIRLFDGDDMHTYRVLSSGLFANIGYAFGRTRQHEFSVGVGYDYNWNYKEKFFQEGKRKEKVKIYSGNGGDRIFASNYNFSAVLTLWGINLYGTYRPKHFINSEFSLSSEQPYYFFPPSRTEIGLGIRLNHEKGTNLHMPESAITSIGILDKKIPKEIDFYNKTLFTKYSLQDGIYDTTSAKANLSDAEVSSLKQDLERRLERLLKQFEKLATLSDSLIMDPNIPLPKIELLETIASNVSATRGPVSCYIDLTTGFLQDIVKYCMGNDSGINPSVYLMLNNIYPTSSSKFIEFIKNIAARRLAQKMENAFDNLTKYQLANQFEEILYFILAHELSHIYFDDPTQEKSIRDEIRADAIAFLVTSEVSPAALEKANFATDFRGDLYAEEENPYAVAMLLSSSGSDYLFEIFAGTSLETGDETHPSFENRKELILDLLDIYLTDQSSAQTSFPNSVQRLISQL